ncbi:MAG: cupin domain-containing protein, partial [Armatimonadetes bacterium]|nr:cupin domain-containing protein [Anaerolineae bacterium]
MDVLTDVLNTVRLKGSVYCRSEITAPWSLQFNATRCATFHVVDCGACWLTLDGDPTEYALSSGDLVMLPSGAGHRISSTLGLAPVAHIQLDVEEPISVRHYCHNE